MLRKSSLTFFLIYFSSNFLEECFAEEFKSSISTCDMIKRTKPLPYPTLAPTNIDTKTAILVNTSSLLYQRNEILGPVLVMNTGSALVIRANPPLTTTSTFGGMLCGEFYVFHQVQFFVSKNLTGRSSYTVDGEGAPLTVSVEFFNIKYGSFKNALKYRNGIVLQFSLFRFLPVDNPLLYPLQSMRKFLRKPGSKLILPAAMSYAWFDTFLLSETYYNFYSAYVDLETGKQYQSAIAGTKKPFFYTLSKRQFGQFFLYLRNKNGKIMDNTLPLQPFGERILLKAVGVGQQLPLF